MLHTYQMILLLGTLPIFCCIQLFLVFKCIGVSSHRKKVFWLIIIYTIIFKAVETGLEKDISRETLSKPPFTTISSPLCPARRQRF